MKSLSARFLHGDLDGQSLFAAKSVARLVKSEKLPRHNLPHGPMLDRGARRCTFPRHIRRLTR